VTADTNVNGFLFVTLSLHDFYACCEPNVQTLDDRPLLHWRPEQLRCMLGCTGLRIKCEREEIVDEWQKRSNTAVTNK